MKNNKALKMFIESIDRKIDESKNAEKTISQLSRLIEITSFQKKISGEIEELILSVSNTCVYDLKKLTNVKESVIKKYNELTDLSKEFVEIEKNIPVDDIYYTSVRTHFNVRRNLNHIKNNELETSMFFISKFKYELKNESVYRRDGFNKNNRFANKQKRENKNNR